MIVRRASVHLSCAVVLGLALPHALGCGQGAEFSGTPPAPDGQLFVSDVYPVLLRDCGFVACHGATHRFFQLWGPGRARLDASTTKPDDPATLGEVVHGYECARSMLATDASLADCLLLSKPLEPSAGGQGHAGVDALGRNVFADTGVPSYQLLLRWARSSGSPPTAAQLDAANAAVSEAESGASP